MVLAAFLSPAMAGDEPAVPAEKGQKIDASDHFDGSLYFNPGYAPVPGKEPRRGRAGWIWRWVFGADWPEWPEMDDLPIGPPPATRAPEGTLRIISVGHATFLIQVEGINILTDPVWSDRASPLSWAGPKRHRKPGIRFEDLPPIDVVLVSHNHYDHCDVSTLKNLAKRGVPRAVAPLGNADILKGAGMTGVEELDWWQTVPLSRGVSLTLVPAQHFSSRSLWDRNKALWGGFVISGSWGSIYFAGDTGYGPHFREIAERFPGIRAAILPISPFRPPQAKEPPVERVQGLHMGPVEAAEAYKDLKAEVGIAAHYQVFQLGPDEFNDAVNWLALSLKARGMKPDAFITLSPGVTHELTVSPKEAATRSP
jgi:L-ascorbate metabolism protein UlaG (beta-lactamase superfamily)